MSTGVRRKILAPFPQRSSPLLLGREKAKKNRDNPVFLTVLATFTATGVI
jgi:hypothetical protein